MSLKQQGRKYSASAHFGDVAVNCVAVHSRPKPSRQEEEMHKCGYDAATDRWILDTKDEL